MKPLYRQVMQCMYKAIIRLFRKKFGCAMFKGEVYVAGGDGTEGVGKLFFKNKYCTG